MMSSVLYLEQFIESLEPLPGELQKNFHEMRKMDEKVELQKATAESMSDVSFLKIKKTFNKLILSDFLALIFMKIFQEYNRSANDMSENELKAQFKRVEAAWQTAYKMQEEKVQLATQTYEMVNKFIKKA